MVQLMLKNHGPKFLKIFSQCTSRVWLRRENTSPLEDLTDFLLSLASRSGNSFWEKLIMNFPLRRSTQAKDGWLHSRRVESFRNFRLAILLISTDIGQFYDIKHDASLRDRWWGHLSILEFSSKYSTSFAWWSPDQNAGDAWLPAYEQYVHTSPDHFLKRSGQFSELFITCEDWHFRWSI